MNISTYSMEYDKREDIVSQGQLQEQKQFQMQIEYKQDEET